MKQHELETLLDNMTDVVATIAVLVSFDEMDKSEAHRIIDGMTMLAIKEHNMREKLAEKITDELYAMLDKLVEKLSDLMDGDSDDI